MSVDAPRLQDAVDKALVPRPPYVIDDLVPPVLDERRADLRRNVVEHLVPRDLFPVAVAALPFSPHRIKYAVLVVDLIERRRPLRAVTPAAAGMIRIALKL